jgi:multidrug efflux pump subunit AcrA (membrane-fusion protein)
MSILTKISKPLGSFSRRFAWLAALLASFLIALVIIITGPSAAPLQRVETAWPISVMPARPTDLSPHYFAYGKVEARQLASLKTTISAPVSKVHRHEGEWVEAGELLIELDSAEAQLAYDIAQANYERNKAQLASVQTDQRLAENLVGEYQQLQDIARAKLQRARDLHGQGVLSDSDLDVTRQEASQSAIQVEQHLAMVADFPNRIAQQQANVNESAAYLEKARIDLDQTRIEAPFAGRVVSNQVTHGDRVIPGAALVEIADYSGLEIRASVTAEIAGMLRHVIEGGSPVWANGEVNGKAEKFPLVRLAADVKAGQSGIDAFFAADKETALDLGRTLQLAITLPRVNDVIPMPVHALYQDHTLYRIVENRLQAVSYEEFGDYRDSSGDFNVLVRSHQVNPGDLLMVSQLPRAITGLLVEPIDVTQTQPLEIK